MRTEHTIGFVIIALLAIDVYLEYLILQELKGHKQ
jgi:hypothetical protein